MRLGDNQRVFVPKTLNDCLNIFRRRPDSVICAGGTFLSIDRPALTRDRDVISLHYIDELSRIFRSDRAVDIGALVPLEKLLNLDEKIIPNGFRDGIAQIATPQVRSIATFGGNLFAGHRFLNLLGWLILHDARIEVKKLTGFRWIPASRFLTDGTRADLAPGEIVTRARVPIYRWNVQKTQRYEIGSALPGQEFQFYSLAAVHSGSIEDLRIAIGLIPNLLLQSRVTDADMVGRSTPLTAKEIASYCDALVENLPIPETLMFPFMTDRIRNLAGSFLFSLGRESTFPVQNKRFQI